MKKLITLCLSLCVGIAASRAQTLLYSQNFNSGSASEWGLSTTDLSGTTASAGSNVWIINNVYTAGPLGTATPTQPGGITGSPTSYYMHINCGSMWSSFYGSNDNFLAGGTGETYFAALQTPVVTTGYTNVYFSFWWLCNGDPADAGVLYYRTSAGGAWTMVTTPIVSFSGSSVWANDSFHLAAFDDQPFLEFGFQFSDGDAGGNDPAFGIDDITVYGTSSGTTGPVASYTSTATTACQDSCITFTSTSTGSPTGYSWAVSPVGPTIGSSTSSSTSICFPASGAYSVTLTATNGSGSNSTTSVINVTPTPHPTITQAGDVLSVPAAYTSYQWYNGLSPIGGATTNSITITTVSTYGVLVDSAGCIGGDTLTAGPLHLTNVANVAGHYWVSQPNNSSVNLNSSKPVDDALLVTIYDATGREILAEKWNAGSFTKEINGLFVSSGLYIIKVSNSYTSSVLKWLKP